MGKPIQKNTPTEPILGATQKMGRVTKLKYTMLQLQHKATTTGGFLRSLQKPAANTFRKFKKPLIIGAVSVALATGTLAATLSTTDDTAPIVQVDPAQVKEQLLDSAMHGDILGIKTALDKGAPVDSRNQIGETPFMIVSRSGSIPRMQFLLSSGANINAQDNEGWTALIGVSRNGHPEAAKFLLESGADPNLSNNSKETPLFWAATQGNNELAIELVKNGAEVNIANENGVAPLMQAASRGHLELCLTLLSAGANVNKADLQGRTAMDYAHMRSLLKHQKIRRLLRAYGAKKAGGV